MDIIYIAAFVILSYTAVNQKKINKEQSAKIESIDWDKIAKEAALKTDSAFRK